MIGKNDMVSKRAQARALRRSEKDAEIKAEDPLDEKPEISEPEPDESEILDLAQQGSGTFDMDLVGHKVVYSLLNVKQQTQALELCTSYHDDTAHGIALETAYFALSVISIDDEPFYEPLANDGSAPLAKFRKALTYYPKVMDLFFAEYVRKENELSKKLENLKK